MDYLGVILMGGHAPTGHMTATCVPPTPSFLQLVYMCVLNGK